MIYLVGATALVVLHAVDGLVPVAVGAPWRALAGAVARDADSDDGLVWEGEAIGAPWEQVDGDEFAWLHAARRHDTVALAAGRFVAADDATAATKALRELTDRFTGPDWRHGHEMLGRVVVPAVHGPQPTTVLADAFDAAKASPTSGALALHRIENERHVLLAVTGPTTDEGRDEASQVWAAPDPLSSPLARVAVAHCKLMSRTRLLAVEAPQLHDDRASAETNAEVLRKAVTEGLPAYDVEAGVRDLEGALTGALDAALMHQRDLTRVDELRTAANAAFINLTSALEELHASPAELVPDAVTSHRWVTTQAEHERQYGDAFVKRIETLRTAADTRLSSARLREETRSNQLTLVQTAFVGALLALVPAVDVLKPSLGFAEGHRWETTLGFVAIVLALPLVVATTYRRSPPLVRLALGLAFAGGASVAARLLGFDGAAGSPAWIAVLAAGLGAGIAASYVQDAAMRRRAK